MDRVGQAEQLIPGHDAEQLNRKLHAETVSVTDFMTLAARSIGRHKTHGRRNTQFAGALLQCLANVRHRQASHRDGRESRNDIALF